MGLSGHVLLHCKCVLRAKQRTVATNIRLG
jgi:hypothetical protein